MTGDWDNGFKDKTAWATFYDEMYEATMRDPALRNKTMRVWLSIQSSILEDPEMRATWLDLLQRSINLLDRDAVKASERAGAGSNIH